MQHCISSPSEATIKFRRIQIAQGPSCETDPLCLFSDFPLVAPKAVGVNLTCIRGKLVKKQSSMRAAMSKIFLKAAGTHRRFPKPRLNIRIFPLSTIRSEWPGQTRHWDKHVRLSAGFASPTQTFFFFLRSFGTWCFGGVEGILRRCFGVLGKMAEKQDVRPSEEASPCVEEGH